MKRHPSHPLGTSLLLRIRCSCLGFKTEKNPQESIDLDTNPWQGLVRIEIWKSNRAALQPSWGLGETSPTEEIQRSLLRC